jgi:hypothetical protein
MKAPGAGGGEMDVELVEIPFQRYLIGKYGRVAGETCAAKGFRLMDAMWAVVKERDIRNHGLNHWVYLPNDTMFTGVEPLDAGSDAGSLEPLELKLNRYLRHVHVGPYTKLPDVWAELKKRLGEFGGHAGLPSVEIYGHWTQDESKLETTILIGV